MSDLYCQCQKQKHFGFSNVRFRRGSIVKSVYVVVVVVASLHHQQSDNFCKMQEENAKWTWSIIYVWCYIVLLSPGAPCICVCVCVCYTALRARGACPLNLFTWPTLTGNLFVRGTGRKWTAGLMTTGCVVELLRVWQPWHSFRTFLNWTDVAWHSFCHSQCKQSVQTFRWAPATTASCSSSSSYPVIPLGT